MTLIFEIRAIVLVVTHHLNEVNICINLYLVPHRYVGVIEQTQCVMNYEHSDTQTNRQCDNYMPLFGGVKSMRFFFRATTEIQKHNSMIFP